MRKRYPEVIADRISVFVDDVYANIGTTGYVGIICAVLLYSIQIYCDFTGYSLMALGLAGSFGIELPVNFKQPYLAKNIPYSYFLIVAEFMLPLLK